MNKLSYNLVFLVVAVIATSAATAQEDTDPNPTFMDLFRGAEVRSIELSPTAEYVVYQSAHTIHVGNPELGYIRLYDFNDEERVRSIQWIGDNSLVIRTYDGRAGRSKLYANKMGIDENGEYAELAWERHTVPGYVHDTLIDDPDRIVFARYRWDDDVYAADLFDIDVFEKSTHLFRWHNAVNTGSKDFFSYIQDKAGNFVVGLRSTDDVPEIWQRGANGKDWVQRWVATKESDIDPVSISDDGRYLYALSNATTDKKAAVVFDLESGEAPRVIYEHERFDLGGVLAQDDDPEPFGAYYSEQGLLRYHFFNETRREEFGRIQTQFPDKGVVIIGRSSDDRVLLVRASTSKNHGEIYRCDMETDSCEMLMPLSPWLDGKVLSDTVVLQTEAEEGLTVDAFLTLPAAGGDSIPLLVMPHGGPIGVRDSRYFSSDVQWLAHNGYAVLQINYRGSSGYGTEFAEAGLRELGRGIEDDIDAAVMTALETYAQLDRNRVGLFGASYGGYSALMSVIRNPDLYRCGASFAGVTDLTLLFAKSRVHKNPELREKVAKIVGDPDLDYEEQTTYSPVYRYREIDRPIFLAHGTKDGVVDIEHSWRLRMLMRRRGVDPDFVVIDDAGHGFDYVEDAELLYVPLLAFLDKHLMVN